MATKREIRKVYIKQNTYDYVGILVGLGILFFLIMAGIYVLNQVPLTEQEAQYHLIKTALENDEIVLKGNCYFEATNIDSNFRTGRGNRLSCSVYEIKIGKK